jgi:hypothetical protein
MSDAILPDCSSAAICRTETKLRNYWLEGSASTIASPPSASNNLYKIEGITVGASFALEKNFVFISRFGVRI